MRNLKPLLVVAAVLLISGLVFAATQASAPAAPAPATAPEQSKSIMDYLLGMLTGSIGGFVASLIGWFKNRNVQTGEQEGYSIKYGFPSTVLGSALGALGAHLNMSPDSIAAAVKYIPAFATVAFASEATLKGVWRHGVVMLKGLVHDWATAHTPPPAPPAAPPAAPK